MSHDAPNVVDLYIVSSETPGDGYFPITFEFDLDAATVTVQVLEPDATDWVAKVRNTAWTLDSGGSRMSFITSTYEPPTGTYVRIARDTSALRVIDWKPGSTLTADQINFDNEQEFYLIQELLAEIARALRLDFTGTYWNAEDLQIKNGSDATAATDYATLRQVQALVQSAEVANLEEATVFSFTGDNSTTEFELQNLSQYTIEEELIVSIDGVIQQTGQTGSAVEDKYYTLLTEDETGYPGGSNPWLVFDTPPTTGQEIEVRVFRGTVLTQIGSNVFGGDSIEDGALEERHFSFPRTSDQRMVFGASGDLQWQEEDDLTPFSTSLEAWFAGKSIGDLADMGGGTSRDYDMDTRRFTNHANPRALQPLDVANKAYVDGRTPITTVSGNTWTGAIAEGVETTIVSNLSYTPNMLHLQVTWTMPGGSITQSYTIPNALGVTGLDTNHGAVLDSAGDTAGNLQVNITSAGFKVKIFAANDSTGITQIKWVAHKHG